jgi:hypothetical protein
LAVALVAYHDGPESLIRKVDREGQIWTRLHSHRYRIGVITIAHGFSVDTPVDTAGDPDRNVLLMSNDILVQVVGKVDDMNHSGTVNSLAGEDPEPVSSIEWSRVAIRECSP